MVEILLPGFILAGFALISASGLYLASKNSMCMKTQELMK